MVKIGIVVENRVLYISKPHFIIPPGNLGVRELDVRELGVTGYLSPQQCPQRNPECLQAER
jgi:hypothetical protein